MESRLNFEFHHSSPLSQDADDYDRKEVYIQYLERKVEQYSSHSTRLGDELMTFCTETKEQTTSLQSEVLKKENEVRDLKEKLRDAEARAMTFSQRLDELAQPETSNISRECHDDNTHFGPPDIARMYREDFYDVIWRSTRSQLMTSTDLDESNIIKFLKDTFVKCFLLCKHALKKQQENLSRVLQYPGANVVILTSEGRCSAAKHSHHYVTRMKTMRSRRLHQADKLIAPPIENENCSERMEDYGQCYKPCSSTKIDKTLASHVINYQRNLQESDLFLVVQDALRKCTRHALFRSCCKEYAVKNILLSKLKPYIQKAVSVSWLMLTQEPVMFIHEQSETSGDTKWDPTVFDIYEGYRGDVVKDVVLPEVYFFQGGMVAAKGVVRVAPPSEQENIAMDLTTLY